MFREVFFIEDRNIGCYQCTAEYSMAAKDMRNIENKRDILSIELKAGNISCRDISWIQTNRRTSEEKIIDWFTSVAVSKNVKLLLEVLQDIIFLFTMNQRPLSYILPSHSLLYCGISERAEGSSYSYGYPCYGKIQNDCCIGETGLCLCFNEFLREYVTVQSRSARYYL